MSTKTITEVAEWWCSPDNRWPGSTMLYMRLGSSLLIGVRLTVDDDPMRLFATCVRMKSLAWGMFEERGSAVEERPVHKWSLASGGES